MAPPKLGDLSENEKTLIENIKSENVEEIKRLLSEKDVRVDCLDEHGMTPLQHASFKASRELCQLFLAHGADVNSNYHDNGYTTLMFAALAGNADVTRIILDAGAKVSSVNSVNRTAAQLAAFVGQHEIATVINNFFSREDLDPYANIQGLDKEPRLPAELAEPLYKFISINNLNPVKLSLYLKENPQLLKQSVKMVRILESLVDKMMKQANTNDIMALKFNYLACLIREMAKATKDNDINNWIKMLLRGREKDGFAQKQEEFIRSTLREFPHGDSQLLQQMIRNLATVTMGNSPTALCLLSQGINGQRFFDDDTACCTCGTPKAEKKCSACKMVHYCNQECQKMHWFTHKKFCKALAAEGERIAKLNKENEELEAKRQQSETESNQQNENAPSDSGDTLCKNVEAIEIKQETEANATVAEVS